jgi:hypothetical protein
VKRERRTAIAKRCASKAKLGKSGAVKTVNGFSSGRQGRNGAQGGIGHKSGSRLGDGDGKAKPNAKLIQKIAGGSMLGSTDIASVAYAVMRETAITGEFYMSASQLAQIIWRVRPDVCRGRKPPSRETIYRVWEGMRKKKLIRPNGAFRTGVRRWIILDEAALDMYAKYKNALREITQKPIGGDENITPLVTNSSP